MVVAVTVLFALLPCEASENNDQANAGEGLLQVEYTIGFETVPAGLDLEIDGIPHTTPIEFVWQEGELHNIAAPSPQAPSADTRHVWSIWSDYGPRSHTIVVMGDENYTAYYDTEYLVTMTTSPVALDMKVDGITYTTPLSFWWVDGSTHELEAILPPWHPREQWLFVGWNDGEPSPKRTIVVDGPKTYIAMYVIVYFSTEISEPPISVGPIPITWG